MHTTVRVAGPDDTVAWSTLRFALWPECPLSRHQLEIGQLLAGAGIVAVAYAEGELAGFAEASVRHDHVEGTTQAPVPYLEGWYVSERYRGLGIGRSLVVFVEQWAVERGYVEMASDAAVDNDHSVRLHSRLGFREVGRSVHFVKKLPTAVTRQPGDPIL
jgi:aminoglycoside 6'-N-acetyltransferase I